MVSRRRLLAASCLSPLSLLRPQVQPEAVTLRTDLPHPRLFLPPRRLRLIRRERERQSLRWVQFQTLIAGGAEMPERGFAHALYWVASLDRRQGRDAVGWALGPGADLRQLALVRDWCQELLDDSERKRLAAKINERLRQPPATLTLGGVRDRVLAAIALADDIPGVEDAVIAPLVGAWWKQQVLDPLTQGRIPIDLRDHLALFELLHALRDNYDLDLRETAPRHFSTLPVYHLLAHYPAPLAAPENDYRIPLMIPAGEPDLRDAVRSRAAALAMVAYDTNAQEMQFLQGWLIQDRYLLRSTLGIPYEFLWANPYLPGLSFHYLPNVFHDPATGRLIIRSSWNDDAVWYFQAVGTRQFFRDGRVIDLARQPLGDRVVMGNTILLAPAGERFTIDHDEPARYYLIGLRPKTRYGMEIDDEEIREVTSDPGGVLALEFASRRRAGVILRPLP